MSTNIESERPLKLSEMARVLGVSVGWLRAEAERGSLPHLKTDRGMLFDQATVERLLSHRAKSEGVPGSGHLARALRQQSDCAANAVASLELAVMQGNRAMEAEARAALERHGLRVTVLPAARRTLRAAWLSDQPAPTSGRAVADGL